MTKLVCTLSLLGLFLIPNASHAGGKNAWTQCGIGAMIFTKTGWAAASSNIIWDWGTTATTSSSSSPSQCAGSGNKMGVLIYENYANVEEETAAGEGEHLNAMMQLLNCDSSIQADLIKDVRADFLKDVQDSSYNKKTTLEKTESLYNNVMDKAEKKYASYCSIG
jgi:hypothetical protein